MFGEDMDPEDDNECASMVLDASVLDVSIVSEPHERVRCQHSQ